MTKEQLIDEAVKKLGEQVSSVDSYMLLAIGPGGTIIEKIARPIEQIARPIMEELVEKVLEEELEK